MLVPSVAWFTSSTPSSIADNSVRWQRPTYCHCRQCSIVYDSAPQALMRASILPISTGFWSCEVVRISAVIQSPLHHHLNIIAARIGVVVIADWSSYHIDMYNIYWRDTRDLYWCDVGWYVVLGWRRKNSFWWIMYWHLPVRITRTHERGTNSRGPPRGCIKGAQEGEVSHYNISDSPYRRCHGLILTAQFA